MREITNIRSIIGGDQSIATFGTTQVRPVSLATMAMLELLGNDCLNMIKRDPSPVESEEAAGEAPRIRMYALAEFVWLHAGDEAEVVRLVAGGSFDDTAAVRRAVLSFAGSVKIADLEGIVTGMLRELEAIASAQAEMNQEAGGSASKN